MHPHYTPEQISYFWSHVDQTAGADACWPWRGGSRQHGYGRCSVAGRDQRAHRVAWIIANGPIPTQLCILHRCDNRLCCNPAHLVVGTVAQNNADMVAKGRHMHGAAHYAHEHPERLARGEQHGQARLTVVTVQEIRRRYEAGEASIRQLASLYGVSGGAVAAIVRRRTWRHLP